MRTTTVCPSENLWCTEHSEEVDTDDTVYVCHRSTIEVAGGKGHVYLEQVDEVTADGVTHGEAHVAPSVGQECPLTLAETAELNAVLATLLAVL